MYPRLTLKENVERKVLHNFDTKAHTSKEFQIVLYLTHVFGSCLDIEVMTVHHRFAKLGPFYVGKHFLDLQFKFAKRRITNPFGFLPTFISSTRIGVLRQNAN